MVFWLKEKKRCLIIHHTIIKYADNSVPIHTVVGICTTYLLTAIFYKEKATALVHKMSTKKKLKGI